MLPKWNLKVVKVSKPRYRFHKVESVQILSLEAT